MTKECTFPIVGIGASAGGLEAMRDLLASLRPDTGMAFVFITHLSRRYESSLPEILARHTTMIVKFAEHAEAVEPNRVYIAPPHAITTLENGNFKLVERADSVQRNPIDVFLSSLAAMCGSRAMGVILSGNGNDGTLGIKAIKENGGYTFAQGVDGSAPQYPSMPDSAIASGVTDLILPTVELAKHMNNMATRCKTKPMKPGQTKTNPSSRIAHCMEF
jgi:two-component system CheB/CheR fusion protein